MNRRDFLKSAILIPGIASLLPVFGRETPTVLPVRCELPDREIVVLESVHHHYPNPKTRLHYAGSDAGLEQLSEAFRGEPELWRCVQEIVRRNEIVELT